MNRQDAERVAHLTKSAVELGVSLALLPVRLGLRAVRSNHRDERWVPSPAVAPATERIGADAPGHELPADPPWEGYDTQNVGTIVARLRTADPAQRALVRRYEEAHKRRLGVLRAAGA